MERDLYTQLLQWRQSPHRKPLILQGARQVGKTYLLQEFGKREYQNTVYFNFEQDPALKEFFAGKLEPTSLLNKLSLYHQSSIQAEHTLIIFDEIQESERALTSLKYFSEQAPEYSIIAAGSLLGVQLSHGQSFPVGKVNFLHLYPFSFFEFLSALGKNSLRQYLEAISKIEPLPEPFHQELLEMLRHFYLIGGLPEAVRVYVESNALEKVRQVHREILNAYQLDFSKHIAPKEVLKISQLWQSIPNQLARENKKFIFSAIRKSARAREYETALQWLTDAGLIYKSYHLPTPKLPASAYAQKNFFKVYLLDVGLLATLTQLPIQSVLDRSQLFEEFNGALTENFVAQELMACHPSELYYWTSPGTAEVDFILDHGQALEPLEVKAGLSKKKKSLRSYAQKYQPPRLLRASLRNLKQDGDFYNYPLYMVSALTNPILSPPAGEGAL